MNTTPQVSENRHFVSKGWGWEDWIVNNNKYCGKVLFVKQGKKCSWHYHAEKDETFYLQSGELIVRFIRQKDFEEQMKLIGLPIEERLKCSYWQAVLRPGHSLHIPTGTVHQFEAVLDSYLFEFSTTHKDEDSIRVVKGD